MTRSWPESAAFPESWQPLGDLLGWTGRCLQVSFLPRVRALAATGPGFSCLEQDRISRQLLQPSGNLESLGCLKIQVLVRRRLKTGEVWTDSSLWGILGGDSWAVFSVSCSPVTCPALGL